MQNDALHRMLTLDKIKRAEMQAEADAQAQANPQEQPQDKEGVLSSLYNLLIGGGDKAKARK